MTNKKILKFKKHGFTLIELLISLFILSILVILISIILRVSIKSSDKILSFTSYNYAAMHKNIMEIYNQSTTVEYKYGCIFLIDDKTKEANKININNHKIYLQRKKNTDDYVGYILLLDFIKEYSVVEDDKTIILSIKDRDSKERVIVLKKKKFEEVEEHEKN